MQCWECKWYDHRKIKCWKLDGIRATAGMECAVGDLSSSIRGAKATRKPTYTYIDLRLMAEMGETWVWFAEKELVHEFDIG